MIEIAVGFKFRAIRLFGNILRSEKMSELNESKTWKIWWGLALKYRRQNLVFAESSQKALKDRCNQSLDWHPSLQSF